jgi:predicted DNA-binding transcriptional regulator AlpA
MGKSNKRYHIDRRAEQIIAFHSNIADDQLLNTKQVAALLSVSEQFVEIARHKGEGPEWTALGPRCIRYQMGAIRQWLADRARMRAQMQAERRRATAHMNKPKAVAKRAKGGA